MVAVTALAVRAWVAWATPHAPPFLDMAEYWTRGAHMWEHGTLFPDSWRMPGLPTALAAAFALSGGPSMDAARAVNVVSGTITAVLTYLLARRGTAPTPALAAGLGVALYPSFVAYTVLVATETLVTAPMMGALLAATYDSRWARIGAGALAAVATLVRPPGLVVLPAAMAAAGWCHQPGEPARRRVAAAGLPLAVFLLVMTPWWLSTVRRHGHLVPFDTTGGFNLLLGNGPQSTGRLETARMLEMSRLYLSHVTRETPEGDRYLRQLALDFVREHPWRTLGLLPAKLTALFALEGREHAYLYSVGQFGELTPITLRAWGAATILSFAVLLPAAVFGVAIRGGVAPIVAVPALVVLAGGTAMHLITFGDPRYHLPFVPVLAVLATGLARAGRAHAPLRLALAALVVVVLASPWLRQTRLYLDVIDQLVLPGGANRPIDYDGLI